MFVDLHVVAAVDSSEKQATQKQPQHTEPNEMRKGTKKQQSSSVAVVVSPLLPRGAPELLQRIALVYLAVDLFRQFYNDQDLSYQLPGEIITGYFFLVVWGYSKMLPSSSSRKRTDFCFGYCLAVWFTTTTAPLWVAYWMLGLGACFLSVSTGFEMVRRLREQEDLNHKKVDDDDELLLVGAAANRPTNDVALEKLRSRERYIRDERKRQKEQNKHEAILLAGVDPSDSNLEVV